MVTDKGFYLFDDCAAAAVCISALRKKQTLLPGGTVKYALLAP